MENNKVKQQSNVEDENGIYLDFSEYNNLTFDVQANTSINVINICQNFKEENKSVKIKVLENSILTFNNIDISHENINMNIDIELYENSKLVFNNIVLGFAKNSSYNLKTINVGQKSKSEVIQKAVVKNKGQVKLNTVGKINKEATFSENFQENLIYLLDESSMGEATPMLLIDNNEVKAGHKAKVSPVDKESIYYLQTRGINKKEAENMLTQAFIKSLVDKMNVDSTIKTTIERLLND